MTPPTILIVEDEVKIAAVLRDYLVAAGFTAVQTQDGASVAAMVREHAPALVLLDLMLPGKSGLEVCRELRTFSDVPVIIVTALVEEVDRLLGLELGADDYICKPFSPREVVVRVRAVLRRVRSCIVSDNGLVRNIGPFVLDEARMRVSLDGCPLELTASEYRLLRKFLRSPGQVFSRSQLLIELKGADDEVFDRAIDTHIKNLRKRLGAASSLLRSVYGVGYQLNIE